MDGLGDRDLDAAYRVDALLERRETYHHIAVYPRPEGIGEYRAELAWPAARCAIQLAIVVGRVDAALAELGQARKLHPQVARHRQHPRAFFTEVDPEQDQRVGAGRTAVVVAEAIDPDKQDVH